LLGYAAISQRRIQATSQFTQIRGADSRLQALRLLTAKATSIEELESSLARLQGPRLEDADRVQPQPVVRSRVNAALDQAASQINRARTLASDRKSVPLLPDLIRSSIACLALGLAGLAQRPGAELSLLQELEMALQGLPLFGRLRRRRLDNRLGDPDYVRRVVGDSEN
jgi:hypothetical protein